MTRALRRFRYRYDAGAGPLSRTELEQEAFTHGNCRLAVQYYLFKAHGLYLGSDDILLPRAYDQTGTFVFKEQPIDFARLRRADILYAENRVNRRQQPMNRGREAFADRDSWVLYFHTAIYLGPFTAALLERFPEGDYPTDEALIWHSTSVDDGACVWPLSRFEHYYRPVSVKRLAALAAA
ncbi:MAG TPA: hypothetical protein VII56_18445 [Rhizomicrobium sp.]